jgi:hypothetical protein
MLTPKQRRLKLVAAYTCVLAVVLLYAPLAGALLLAHGMDCCAGGYCPIREHHHQKQQTPTQDSMPMDCGHDMSGMTACSVSCCQESSRPAVMPVAFVLPLATMLPAAVEMVQPVRITTSLEISQIITPLSPPPRLVA